jgi:hypothetical protein
MKAQAERGEINLAYVDEAGFALAQPNRSAWTPVGKCHMIPELCRLVRKF